MSRVIMKEHYSLNRDVTFYKGTTYSIVKDSLVGNWVDIHSKDGLVFSIPVSYVEFVNEEGNPLNMYANKPEREVDAWTLIVDRTGIDRQKVKRFFFKYWHEIPIPTICKEEKIRCQDVAHMIAVFNEWADAQDPEDR
ncbi:hypothetical protein VPHD69_0108 [Vibrio phage D69]